MDARGVQFAEALGRKDGEALKRLLRDDVDFRGMTPGRFWEAANAADVVDGILLGKWFEPADVITRVVSIETSAVGTRERVGYRFEVVNPDGHHLVEQQAYLGTDGDRISWLRIMCSGFMPRD